MTFRRTALVAGLLLTPALARAEAGARTHVVYDGQRLGTIAKRYGVSVDAICAANSMRPTDALKPGQHLIIPGHGDRDGSRASIAAHDGSRHRSASEHVPLNRTHRVESGQRLDSIARRYGVSVDALRAANGIGKKGLIHTGQVLRIPDKDASPDAIAENEAAEGSSHAYLRPPAKRGLLDLTSYNEHFHGVVFDRKGHLLPLAFNGVSRVLAATGSRPRLDPRLIRLLTDASDAFGGRPLRIVSGFRTTSFFQDSRHKISKAVDFSIPGVPNQVVRDYLRTLSNVGVGYYPNSSFVHLDVREYSAYWIDYAGPGEAPRHKRHEAADADDVHEEEPSEVPDDGAPSAAHDAGALPALTELASAPSHAAPSEANAAEPSSAAFPLPSSAISSTAARAAAQAHSD